MPHNATQGAGKRRAIQVAIGGLIAAAGIAVLGFLLHGDGQIPHVAAQLSARDTVGLVAVESPDRWVQAFDRAAAGLSADEKRSLAPLLSRENRAHVLGFDPATAGGWQQAGLDPERGLAVTFAAPRTATGLAAPYVWVAGGPPHLAQADGLKWQSLAKWSVAALPIAAQASPPPWNAPDGPRLDRDPVLLAAFADLPTGARTALYAHADGLRAALAPLLEGQKRAALEHVTRRVRGVSLVIAPDRTGGRVVLSADGIESLRQIFGDQAPHRPFSPFLPRDGVVALRISMNLQEIFDGLMTWLPPESLNARLGLASGRLGLLALTGLDWTQLERALTGQAVLALDLSAPPTPETPVAWLALLSVRDGAVADAALAHLAQRSTQRGTPVVAVQVAGHPGWQAQRPAVVAVRVAETLVMAPNLAAAERALHQPQPMTETADLDGDVVLGLAFRPVLSGAQATDPPDWRAALAHLEPLALAVRRDAHGLKLEASSLPLSSLLHLAAWFLRPVPG